MSTDEKLGNFKVTEAAEVTDAILYERELSKEEASIVMKYIEDKWLTKLTRWARIKAALVELWKGITS